MSAVLLLATTAAVACSSAGPDNSGYRPPRTSGPPTVPAAITAPPQQQIPMPAVTGAPVTTEDGLKYIDIDEGLGPPVAAGQTVNVNYTGWLESNGQKFDSSYDRNQPISFVLGQGQVIKGWDEGLSTMRVGGSRRLIIPPDLAYGSAGQGALIPPNSTLIFDVQIMQAATGGG